MGDPVTMALVGAGVGAGSSLLRGKGVGSALQNAAIGGALGGAGGMFGNAIKGASAVAPVAEATTGAIPNGVMSSWGTTLNPEYFALANTPMATYKGGEGLLANATGNLLSGIPDYVTPQNVLGAANIISNIQPQQIPPAASGQVRPGSVQGLNVNYGMAQPIKRRGYA
jgi:hypothetical protein